MRLPKLPAGLTRAFGKIFQKTKSTSPEICVIGGILCGGAAVVLVGVETWKNKEKLEKDIQDVKDYTAKGQKKLVDTDPTMELYLDEDERKKSLKMYSIILAKDLGKAYWKPLLLGVTSVGLIWGGRTLLRKELSVATTALVTLKQQYDSLVKKMHEELGDEKTQELLYGAQTMKAFDEKGKELDEPVALVDKAKMISPYAFTFDDGEFDGEKGMYIWRNPVWNTSKTVNIATVVSIQNSLNDVLKMNGYVYENEARAAFGMKPLKRGWRYGWVLGSEGDGYIDFGVLPGAHQIPINKLFMDEKNSFNTPIIDLNVDGRIDYIYDDIFEYDNRSNIAFNKRRDRLAKNGKGLTLIGG